MINSKLNANLAKMVVEQLPGQKIKELASASHRIRAFRSENFELLRSVCLYEEQCLEMPKAVAEVCQFNGLSSFQDLLDVIPDIRRLDAYFPAKPFLDKYLSLLGEELKKFPAEDRAEALKMLLELLKDTRFISRKDQIYYVNAFHNRFEPQDAEEVGQIIVNFLADEIFSIGIEKAMSIEYAYFARINMPLRQPLMNCLVAYAEKKGDTQALIEIAGWMHTLISGSFDAYMQMLNIAKNMRAVDLGMELAKRWTVVGSAVAVLEINALAVHLLSEEILHVLLENLPSHHKERYGESINARLKLIRDEAAKTDTSVRPAQANSCMQWQGG